MSRHMEHDGTPRTNRWRVAIWGTAALLLLLPAVAMRFTDEVNWTGFDFVVMGAMLAAACGAYELGARLSGDTVYRAAVGVAVVTAFLLVWINLAVGIIGSENDRANLVFAGVLAVLGIGACIARFRPCGMARALNATAIAQALAAVYALFVGRGPEGPVLSAVFTGAWLVSAWLFGRAARQRDAVGRAR